VWMTTSRTRPMTTRTTGTLVEATHFRPEPGMRTMRSSTSGRRRERGVALLLVLWIFVILGVLAVDFARYIRDDAMAAVNFAEETRAYYVALAGMNRTIFEADRAHERAAPGAPTPTPAVDDEDEDEPLPADGQWHDG